MANITTTYLGLSLKSPFIAASSGLTIDVEKVKKLAESGIGAIIVKSLFEEQIGNESQHLVEQSQEHSEANDYIHHFVRQNTMGKYCETLKEIKQAVDIPVIASINCYSEGEWIEFAKEIASTGIDALEINIYSIPLSIHKTAEEIEGGYINILKKIISSISIPVAVKIGYGFTNIPAFVDKIKSVGAKSVVMFNRFYTPDIDIDKFELVPSEPFSSPNEYVRELRAIAITSSLVSGIDISASTGIHTPEAGIKAILAGSTTVQLCSILYKSGVEVVKNFNSYLNDYMDKNGFNTLSDFKGKLNYSKIASPEKFERTQFLKTFGNKK